MPITEFKVRKEVLINTLNYENTKVSHEMTYQVGEDEDVDEAREYVTKRLDSYLNEQVRLVKSMRGK